MRHILHPKLNDLARHAEVNDSHYRRIDAVSELNGKYKILDLKEKETRDVVLAASSAKSLYQSNIAIDYPT